MHKCKHGIEQPDIKAVTTDGGLTVQLVGRYNCDYCQGYYDGYYACVREGK